MTYPPQFQAPDPSIPPAQQFQQAPPQYAPQPQYAPPPAAPYYPAQPQYAPQPQFSQPSQAVQQATGLSDFWDQRNTGEGEALKFPAVGSGHIFKVTRTLTAADVSHQTNPQGVPQYDKSGNPKWQLVIPGRTPEGKDVVWYCKGQAKTALQSALTKAGVPEVEADSIIQVVHVKDKPSGQGYHPAKIYDVQYTRPAGAPTGTAPTAAQVADGVLAEGGSYAQAAQTSAQYAQGQAASGLPVAPVAVAAAATPVQAAPVAAPVAPPAPVPVAAPVAPVAAPVAPPITQPVADPQALFAQLVQD